MRANVSRAKHFQRAQGWQRLNRLGAVWAHAACAGGAR